MMDWYILGFASESDDSFLLWELAKCFFIKETFANYVTLKKELLEPLPLVTNFP